MPVLKPLPEAPVIEFIRGSEVCRITGLPVSTLYAKMAAGEFPRPVRLSDEHPSGRNPIVAWLRHEVVAWQERRIAERDALPLPEQPGPKPRDPNRFREAAEKRKAMK
jgi:prophage regulatory protein